MEWAIFVQEKNETFLYIHSSLIYLVILQKKCIDYLLKYSNN